MILSTSAVAVCCCERQIRAQLVEQPRVLDGDDGLSGEVCHQLYLLIRERPYLLTVDPDGPDQLAFVEHRHVKKASRSSEFGGRDA